MITPLTPIETRSAKDSAAAGRWCQIRTKSGKQLLTRIRDFAAIGVQYYMPVCTKRIRDRNAHASGKVI
jgi:hypothetical protein